MLPPLLLDEEDELLLELLELDELLLELDEELLELEEDDELLEEVNATTAGSLVTVPPAL
jgi:hypothetical protein